MITPSLGCLGLNQVLDFNGLPLKISNRVSALNTPLCVDYYQKLRMRKSLVKLSGLVNDGSKMEHGLAVTLHCTASKELNLRT